MTTFSLSRIRALSRRTQGFRISTKSRLYSTEHTQCLPGLYFWPSYFSHEEQKTLLAASLYKLDSLETRQARRKRQEFWKSKPSTGPTVADDSDNVTGLFAPDSMYEFQEGHFDGVIHHYREMHLSAWPVEKYLSLEPVLKRLQALFPDPNSKVQMHLLHLASYGEILPHIDNLDASGSWILGVSLGHERILHLKAKSGAEKEWSLTLPSGSVYLQRDRVRYDYLHSIRGNLPAGTHDQAGQRLSVMIRRNINRLIREIRIKFKTDALSRIDKHDPLYVMEAVKNILLVESCDESRGLSSFAVYRAV